MKERIDKVLLELKLISTRSQAKMLIEKGDVYCNDIQVKKPGQLVSPQDKFEIRTDIYVSRGAFKLIKALDEFKINLEGKVIADIGASTGGFTQVCLERGASKIFCIDVGHGQLHESLKNNPKVINLEGVHILDLDLTQDVDICVVDLSFISFLKVVKKIGSLTKGPIIALIKPQFEAGVELMGKKAVLSKELSQKVFENVLLELKKMNFKIKKIIPSPILGKEGNTEFLIELYSES